MKSRLEKWMALEPCDRGVLLRAAVTLPIIAIGLRLIGYKRLKGLLETISRPSGSLSSIPASDQLIEAQRIAQLVRIAAGQMPVPATCLRQAMVVFWFLRGRGMDAKIQLGVRNNDGSLGYHAWVEVDGMALDADQNHVNTYAIIQPLAQSNRIAASGLRPSQRSG